MKMYQCTFFNPNTFAIPINYEEKYKFKGICLTKSTNST